MFTRTLPHTAQNALALLGQSRFLQHTYLAGGSALALHLGHRYSVDFDFFSRKPINAKQLAEKLTGIGTFKTQMTDKKTLIGEFNAIKFSLFHYDYPLIAKLHQFKGISIADPADIAGMKIVAICDRGTKKDYVDLYFLAKERFSWEKMFDIYQKKYKLLANNIYTIITAMRYFAEAEETEMPKMIKQVSWQEIKKFFEKEAIRLGKKYLF